MSALLAPLSVSEVARPSLRAMFVPGVASVLLALRHPIRRWRAASQLYAIAGLLVVAGAIGLPAAPTLPLDLGGALGGVIAGVAFIAFLLILGSLWRWWSLRRHAEDGKRAWLATDPTGRVRGTAVLTPNGDAWKITDTAAWPNGKGIGHPVMQAVCAAADLRRHTLNLEATNAIVARWYTAHGFEYVNRTHGSRIPMRRQPRPPAAQA